MSSTKIKNTVKPVFTYKFSNLEYMGQFKKLTKSHLSEVFMFVTKPSAYPWLHVIPSLASFPDIYLMSTR